MQDGISRSCNEWNLYWVRSSIINTINILTKIVFKDHVKNLIIFVVVAIGYSIKPLTL